jgi:hypothetical protein
MGKRVRGVALSWSSSWSSLPVAVIAVARCACRLGGGGVGSGGGGGGHEVGVVVKEAARYRSTPVRCEAPIKVRF